MSVVQSKTATPSQEVLQGEGVFQETAGLQVFADFDQMGLPMELLRGIYSHGFERPSPIQTRALVPISKGGDVIAQAQSGTGKTGAFTIGVMARMDWTRRSATQALILSPTRELADQTHEVPTPT